jgi:hypothetical protein
MHSEEWSSLFFFDLCFDDHGSSRNLSVSFSPTQTSLRSHFDHDYFFGLPSSGSRMPNQVHDALLHAMSGTELSHVRTELQRR